MIRKIPPILAAAMMGKNPQFVRIGLQRGLLPFGVCATNSNARRSRHNYYISPKLFMDYTGFTEADIQTVAAQVGVTL